MLRATAAFLATLALPAMIMIGADIGQVGAMVAVWAAFFYLLVLLLSD